MKFLSSKLLKKMDFQKHLNPDICEIIIDYLPLYGEWINNIFDDNRKRKLLKKYFGKKAVKLYEEDLFCQIFNAYMFKTTYQINAKLAFSILAETNEWLIFRIINGKGVELTRQRESHLYNNIFDKYDFKICFSPDDCLKMYNRYGIYIFRNIKLEHIDLTDIKFVYDEITSFLLDVFILHSDINLMEQLCKDFEVDDFEYQNLRITCRHNGNLTKEIACRAYLDFNNLKVAQHFVEKLIKGLPIDLIKSFC